MHKVITWFGFFGAWLLFAGPIYQAALELREQEIRREDIQHAFDGLTPPPRVSPWWWLILPVKYLLERRRNRAFRQAALARLSSDQVESLISYLNKAIGWMIVGTGGLLIAVNDTGELVEAYDDWPEWVFAPLFVPVVISSIGYVWFRMRRNVQIVRGHRVDTPANSPELAAE